MDDRKRITIWMSESEFPWLNSELERIEKESGGKHFCEIKEDKIISKTSGRVLKKYALFYKNGYYHKIDGAHLEWVRG